jgi:hypothetical protein
LLTARTPARAQGSAARLANAEAVRKQLGLTSEYANVRRVEDLKIAVLDVGFEGVGPDRPYLPANAVVVEDYDPEFVRGYDLGDPDFRKGFEPGNRHGREMAQIVWAVTGSRPAGPKFYLLNANGPTMLRRAVCKAIVEHVDIILFSGAFEGGGNGDGRGPINRIVDEALAAGILWINAAGNYGQHVYQGPVRVLPDGHLRLRDKSDIAALRFRNHLDENIVTVTLTWNDYRDEEDAGTDKDLDLYVEDWKGRVIGSGAKLQVSGDRVTGPDETRNPRERVVLTDLPASPDLLSDSGVAYRIRVRAKSGRFTPADQVRVLVMATQENYVAPGGGLPRSAVEFLDASRQAEIYPPADHPLVFTVGDAAPSSSIGPTTDGRPKPDTFLEDSSAFFTDGTVSRGSSNAAAYLTGVVAVLKAAEPNLRASHLLWLARHDGRSSSSSVRPSPIDQPTQSIPWPPIADRRLVPERQGISVGLTPTLYPGVRLGFQLDVPSSTRTASRPPTPPPPRDERVTRFAKAWQTPSRARLAEVVRGGR